MAREDRLEAVAKHEAVESGRWRDNRGPQFAPESRMFAAALQQEAGHPKQRFTQEGSGRAGRDLVIDRGQVGFPGYFPDKAAGVAVDERLPEGGAG